MTRTPARIAWALAATLLLVTGSSSASISAKNLRNQCTSKLTSNSDSQQQALSGAETSFKLGYCGGYIAGFMDANANIRDGVSVKQIEDAFLQYLEAHPAEENSTAWWILEASSRAAGLTYKK
jgi:Rap1a immunity proteins